MPAITQENAAMTHELLSEPMQLRPLTHGFHLAGEKKSHSETESPQLTGNWQKQENTEHSDADEDVQLHELMEDIKRYIRSIDISSL